MQSEDNLVSQGDEADALLKNETFNSVINNLVEDTFSQFCKFRLSGLTGKRLRHKWRHIRHNAVPLLPKLWHPIRRRDRGLRPLDPDAGILLH